MSDFESTDNTEDDDVFTDEEQIDYEELMQQLTDIEKQIDLLNIYVAMEDSNKAWDTNTLIVGLVEEFEARYVGLFGHLPEHRIAWTF